MWKQVASFRPVKPSVPAQVETRSAQSRSKIDRNGAYGNNGTISDIEDELETLVPMIEMEPLLPLEPLLPIVLRRSETVLMVHMETMEPFIPLVPNFDNCPTRLEPGEKSPGDHSPGFTMRGRSSDRRRLRVRTMGFGGTLKTVEKVPFLPLIPLVPFSPNEPFADYLKQFPACRSGFAVYRGG